MYYNLQLRHLFENLNPPVPQREFLYEMAVHTVDTNEFSVLYDTLANDTNNANTWLDQYNEIRYMAFDTNHILPTLSFGENAYDYVREEKKIPIGILHVQYYHIKHDALTTGNYFDFDIANNTFHDLPNGPMPYTVHSVFSSSALTYQIKGLNPTFVFDKKWFVLDEFTKGYYTVPGYVFEIDLGDGSRIQTFPANQAHEITANYSTEGEKIISVTLRAKSCVGQIVYSNRSKVLVNAVAYVLPPDQEISRTGMNIGIYSPCQEATNPGRKIAIVVEGFDFMEDQSASDVYNTVITNTHISELRDFGYEFHVIDWKNSKLDMRTNAGYLMDYMHELKCELINANEMEPMVVIGHSMGGIIARYALTKWEYSPLYPTCADGYMHFTRLLLTLDAPHQGANIPLAYQHYYRNTEWLLKMKLVSRFAKIGDTKIEAGLLDSMASKQLLMYHVDTKNGKLYDMHAERKSFMHDLDSMGNYPSFCKIMATSSGSAKGTKQENPFTGSSRIAGDKLFQVDGFAYARFLFWVKPISFVDLKMETADASNNEVYRSVGTQWFFKITLKLFTLKIKLDKTLSPILSYKANIHSYDVESGGNLNLNFAPKTGFNYGGWPKNSFPLLHAFSLVTSLGPGKWLAGAEAGIGFVLGVGGVAIIQSDGFDFNFVPLRSALDYGGSIYSGPQSPNIENTSPAVVMANTPSEMDVVMAVPERSPYQLPSNNLSNYPHTHLYNPRLYRSYPSDIVEYRNCKYNGITKYSHLLNREIGDEKLYLENFTQKFSMMHIRTEFDILINVPNPAYHYPGLPPQLTMEPAAFSKDAPYINLHTAEFYSDQGQAQSFPIPDWSPGFIYNSPQTGVWTDYNTPFFTCCQNSQLMSPSNPTEEESLNAEWLERDENRQWLKVELKKPQDPKIVYQLYDVQGKLIDKGEWKREEEGRYSIHRPKEKGMYLLKIQSNNKSKTLKLMVTL